MARLALAILRVLFSPFSLAKKMLGSFYSREPTSWLVGKQNIKMHTLRCCGSLYDPIVVCGGKLFMEKFHARLTDIVFHPEINCSKYEVLRLAICALVSMALVWEL